MIKIIMSGCNGKMGQVITRLVNEMDDVEIVAGIDVNDSISNSYPLFKNPFDCNIPADAIIDFSHPAMFDKITDYAVKINTPIIVATTGLTEENMNKINIIKDKVAIFFSANMSLGINVLIELLKKATPVLEDNFDIEIVEKHHNQKIDAPSGTALALADAVKDTLTYEPEYKYERHSERVKRDKKEIGLHAIRGGTIVGEHTVIYAGTDEVIELKHTATSKEVFAVGAIKAAKFLKGKPAGRYSMTDLVNS